jgi:hypothetical protein
MFEPSASSIRLNACLCVAKKRVYRFNCALRTKSIDEKKIYKEEFAKIRLFLPLEPPSLNLSNCHSCSPDGGGTISSKYVK